MNRNSLYRILKRRFNPLSRAYRREFLQAAMATVAWQANRRISQAASGSSQPRVLVVGAGFAGLSCAYQLRGLGVEVTVIEARNRVGGRVLTFENFAGVPVVEGGGELIGENHATWWTYANELHLELVELEEEADLRSPVVIGDERLTDREAIRLFEIMDEVYSSLTRKAAGIDASQPWLSHEAGRLDETSIEAWLKELTAEPRVKRFAGLQLASDNAVENDRASLLGMLAAIEGGGGDAYWELSETHRCASGNQTLARRLAESIGQDRIRLSTPVASISSQGKTCRSELGDGSIIETDLVVLAVPPSVWSNIQFSPSLPEHLALQMGRAFKHLVGVDKRFWIDERYSADGYSDGLICQSWESMKQENAAVLTGFSGASQAEKYMSLSRKDRDEKIDEAWEKLYPGFQRHAGLRRPMVWPEDRWTQGAYSFPAPGEITRVGPLLQAGIGPLHFVGEHTCYAFVGYMEGALRSGVEKARQLARILGVIESTDC
jgi:monoamine oxidase